MTAFKLIQEYKESQGELPREGHEYEDFTFYVQQRNFNTIELVDVPDEDSVIAVCQMLRRQQQEAAGQGRLF